MFEWLATEATHDQIEAGSCAATIHDAVERGDIPGAKAHEMLSTYIAPALDTTIHSFDWAL
ncbi:MAG: hypothetical protein JST53_09670 [Actinobacteria bacterium]|nr:hypothetical protein [Actinomycetota bacterium]